MGVKDNPTKSTFSTRNFIIDVQEGDVTGHKILRLFGYTSSAGSSETDLWTPATTKVYPSATAVCVVATDNGADDIAGGGARTILVKGLDANFDELEDTVTMNGTSVNTSKPFFRINGATVLTAGGETANTGTITLTIFGDLQARIEPNEGVVSMSHFTTAKNQNMYIFHASIRSEESDVIVRTKAREEGGTFLVRNRLGISAIVVNEVVNGFIKVPEKTDLKATVVHPSGASIKQLDITLNAILIEYVDAP